MALGIEIEDNIPKYDQYYGRYGLDQKIHFPVKNVEDKNTADEINNIRKKVLEHMREIEGAPSMQIRHLPAGLSPWTTNDYS